MSEVTALKPAESPFKANMLELLDTLRQEVEAGKVINLVAIPIEPNMAFNVRSAGEVKLLTLAGLLSVAWHDAVCQMSP